MANNIGAHIALLRCDFSNRLKLLENFTKTNIQGTNGQVEKLKTTHENIRAEMFCRPDRLQSYCSIYETNPAKFPTTTKHDMLE